MADENDRSGMLPDLHLPDPLGLKPPSGTESPMKPWEQRIGPGMAAGGGSPQTVSEAPSTLDHVCQAMGRDGLVEVINQQTDLIHLPMVDSHTTPATDLSHRATSNAEVWQLFVEEQLYDTRRVTLEHFHLFEWFPNAPGLFHTPEGYQHREVASRYMEPTPDGSTVFNPVGKLTMLKGGIGAVRLRPREIAGEPHYFMTASSSGVCHEGFPVLIPRRFYGPLKARILDEGAVPVTVSGEMRYVPEDAVSFFPEQRRVPLLYLHVDELRVLSRPRSDVTAYLINVVVSFAGEFEGVEGSYATFAAFDPARRLSLSDAISWLQRIYVGAMHGGTVITDFDEVRPRFRRAVFGLPSLMAGNVDRAQVRELLAAHGFSLNAGDTFYVVYNEINTHGGAYIAGDVHVENGDFIGRDQILDRDG